jgi:hypothetical protein
MAPDPARAMLYSQTLIIGRQLKLPSYSLERSGLSTAIVLVSDQGELLIRAAITKPLVQLRSLGLGG